MASVRSTACLFAVVMGLLCLGLKPAAADPDTDLKFFRILRQIAAGHVAESAPVLEKISKLVYDPMEGRLTLAFVESAIGNKALALDLLKEWLATNPHTPDRILGIRLTTFYASDIVKTAIEEDDINTLLVSAFGGRVVKRLDSAISDVQLALEPPCKTINPKDGAVMVLVPGGPFLMGQKNRPDNPRNTINLTGYWIYETPVTVAEYKKFCVATGKPMPPEPMIANRSFNPGWSKKNHPIVNVSWDDAVAYCKWAGARLPTEAEWEKAARGVEGWRYPWGNSYDPSLLQHSREDGDAGGTSSVGSFPKGVSPYGALDMVGNVWQWCSDFYSADYWRHPAPVDPTGPASGRNRAVHAGSWYDDDDFDYYVFRREKYDPSGRYTVVGFRCVSGL